VREESRREGQGRECLEQQDETEKEIKERERERMCVFGSGCVCLVCVCVCVFVQVSCVFVQVWCVHLSVCAGDRWCVCVLWVRMHVHSCERDRVRDNQWVWERVSRCRRE